LPQQFKCMTITRRVGCALKHDEDVGVLGIIHDEKRTGTCERQDNQSDDYDERQESQEG
jgi:hypothetical protein